MEFTKGSHRHIDQIIHSGFGEESQKTFLKDMCDDSKFADQIVPVSSIFEKRNAICLMTDNAVSMLVS